MNISSHNNNNYNPIFFQAKVPLNKINNYLAPQQKGTTKLDTMFRQNYITRKLEDFSIYLRKNIANEYFLEPTNTVSKICKQIIDTGVKYSRTLANKISYTCNRSGIKKLDKNFVNMDQNSKEYIEEFAKVGNTLNKKYIVTNIESKTLENIGKSDKATIFLLNHPNFHKDKFVYVILNSMLNKIYVNEGKQASCPRPKILASKYMRTMLGEKMGNIYKQLGLVEIDPAVKNRQVASNATPMKKLLKEFIQDKSNVFIFPEGNNSTLKNTAFEKRIQPGIAEFIKQACGLKSEVQVVPIGINYTKDKNCMGKIFIGEPMYFKKTDNGIKFNQSNITESINGTKPKEVSNSILDKISSGIKKCMEEASELT